MEFNKSVGLITLPMMSFFSIFASFDLYSGRMCIGTDRNGYITGLIFSVTTIFVILEHSYLFSIVLVIPIFSLKGSCYIWFSVRMHVSVYLENECIHLLLELIIVPMLLDGCSGSSSPEKASFVWYSSWSRTSWSCCCFFYACLQYLHCADLAGH